ncbi:Uncharacterised protein [Bordetella pertussis]|nr:Uncharacterised protein [Bordetella pertussis]
MPMNSSPSPVTATGWSLCTSCAPSSTACCAAAAISTPARRLPSSTGAYS